MKSNNHIIILLLLILVLASCTSNKSNSLSFLDEAVATTQGLTEYTVLIDGGSDKESLDVMISYSESQNSLLYEGIHSIEGVTYYLVTYKKEENFYLKEDTSDTFIQFPIDHYVTTRLNTYLSQANITYGSALYTSLRENLKEEMITIRTNQTIDVWPETLTQIHFSFPSEQVTPLYKDILLEIYQDNISAQVEQRIEAHRFLTEAVGQIWNDSLEESLRESYNTYDLTDLEALVSDMTLSDITYDFYVNSEGIIVYSTESYTLTNQGQSYDYFLKQQFKSYQQTVNFPPLDDEKIISYEDYKQNIE